MASIPTPAPVWPLPGIEPRYSDRSFGGKRPSSCDWDKNECERWHCGNDLIDAPGARVVACEAGVVVKTDAGWSNGTVATFIRSASFFTVYGGLKKGTSKVAGVNAGDKVVQGQDIGELQADKYKMLHFELYVPDPGRKHNSPWYNTEKNAPDGLLNPINYIQVAATGKYTLITPIQRHHALATLGFYKGTIIAPWSSQSKSALKEAQADLKIDVDGAWGPETDTAIQAALRSIDDGEPTVADTNTIGNGHSCRSDSCSTSDDSTVEEAVTPVRGFWTPQRKIQLAMGGVGLLAFGYYVARRRS